MAIALPAPPERTAPSGRGFTLLVIVLAAFIAVPWLVRPLERWLSLPDVALMGAGLETLLGAIVGVWMFRLIRRQHATALEHARELERVSEFDALTGLGNTRALARDLERTLNRARRTQEAVSVLYLDVDAMRDVNKRHGRAIGDQTLRMLGAVLRSSVRYGIDAGYRIADDEFAIVLAADRDSAQSVSRRLEWNFQERTPRQSSVSVGLATWDGRKGHDGLLDEARRALAAQRRTAMVAQMA